MIDIKRFSLPPCDFTSDEIRQLKWALKKHNWRGLKTWKLKFFYQALCGDTEQIKAIGLVAKKVNLENMKTYRPNFSHREKSREK